MKPLNVQAQKVMEALVDGLSETGHHKKINNAQGVFMAVSVECIGLRALGSLFSVAHYYEQNGDLMRDPEMVFLRGLDGCFYPIYFRQDGGYGYDEDSADLEAGAVRPAMQADHARFANRWMHNIKQQQQL